MVMAMFLSPSDQYSLTLIIIMYNQWAIIAIKKTISHESHDPRSRPWNKIKAPQFKKTKGPCTGRQQTGY
jgi:hypothetical protein